MDEGKFRSRSSYESTLASFISNESYEVNEGLPRQLTCSVSKNQQGLLEMHVHRAVQVLLCGNGLANTSVSPKQCDGQT